LLDLGATAGEVRRSGNEHREFVPVNVYETADSWLYVAIGNDVQWRRLTSLAPFRSLARDSRETNEGRKAERAAIHDELARVVRAHRTEELLSLLGDSGIVVSPVHTVEQARDLTGIREHLTRTTLPDGRGLRLPPAAVDAGRTDFPLAPRYGEHTREILREAGLENSEIDGLERRGVVH
jgi:crotonobetainyl-CoA:carnitine CoA-transferase CaiB-like acyl-CoA transferase